MSNARRVEGIVVGNVQMDFMRIASLRTVKSVCLNAKYALMVMNAPNAKEIELTPHYVNVLNHILTMVSH